MNAIVRIGIDLVKNVMQIHAVDSAGHVVIRRCAGQCERIDANGKRRFVDGMNWISSISTSSGWLMAHATTRERFRGICELLVKLERARAALKLSDGQSRRKQ